MFGLTDVEMAYLQVYLPDFWATGMTPYALTPESIPDDPVLKEQYLDHFVDYGYFPMVGEAVLGLVGSEMGMTLEEERELMQRLDRLQKDLDLARTKEAGMGVVIAAGLGWVLKWLLGKFGSKTLVSVLAGMGIALGVAGFGGGPRPLYYGGRKIAMIDGEMVPSPGYGRTRPRLGRSKAGAEFRLRIRR